MKKFAVICAAALALTVFGGCTVPENTDPLKAFEGLPEIPLSSIHAVEEDGGLFRAKFRVPETDAYTVEFSKKAVTSAKFYKEDGSLLAESGEETVILNLEEGEIVYGEFRPAKTSVRVTIEGTSAPQPFDILGFEDPSTYETTSADPTVSPLEAAELKYVKRPDTLYVYSNAPETLTPEAVNKCLTRQDVSDQSVFFTFEHQSTKIVNDGVTKGVYYGYRVTNTGTEDMYITVKNIGFQLDGAGCWLGEKEWLEFYNLPLRVKGLETLTKSQQDHFIAYFNFCNTYTMHDFRPTTYRIPAGEFMYVIGGTKQDAYGGFGVNNTADRISTYSEVANGAVLFDVVGEAEGAFYVYDDIAAVNKGGAGYDTHVGIRDMKDPRGSIGQEAGYVVDNSATWVFNDATKAQRLPVTFENYYNEKLSPYVSQGLNDPVDPIGAAQKVLAKWVRDNYPDSVSTNIAEDGSIIPCSPIPDGDAPHRQNRTDWATHFDAQSSTNHEAVGTDITVFHTVNSAGTDHPVEDIAFGLYNFSTQGIVLCMGNWMKDYQDAFTFVNQGDTERTIRINVMPSGAVAAFFRDANGVPIRGTEVYGIYHGPIDLAVHQEFKIPAHSVFQVVCEYNLMANSNGYMRHSIELI